MATSEKPLVIAVVVFEGVMQQDFIGVTSFLEQLPTSCDQPVKFLTVSVVKGPLRSRNPLGLGMPLYASHSFQDVDEPIDILLVPGGRGRFELQQHDAFMAFLKQAATSATFVLTVCTGSAILADTGFLDGKRATTNKIAFDEVAQARTQVQWVRRARWVVDGNVWTSSGVTAGIDMAHAFVAAQYGQKAADGIARHMENVPNTDPNNDPFTAHEVGQLTPACVYG